MQALSAKIVLEYYAQSFTFTVKQFLFEYC